MMLDSMQKMLSNMNKCN